MKCEDIMYIERNVKATLAIEGLKPSRQGENITNLFLRIICSHGFL